MGRWGDPDDAARLIAWLVSDDARWIKADPAQIDQDFRVREPQFHHRKQAVASGKKLGLLSLRGKETNRFAQGLRCCIFKRSRNHLPPLAFAGSFV